MSSNNALVVKDKVQRFAKQFFQVVNLDDDGDLSIPWESTNLHVQVFDNSAGDEEWNKFRKENDISFTSILVWAMVLWSAKPSNELYKWVATEGQTFDFGGFKVVPREDGNVNVIFQYTLPGDNLDPGELKNSLACVAFTADGHDDELKSKFGGQIVADLRKS